jgi:hypothetical protein
MRWIYLWVALVCMLATILVLCATALLTDVLDKLLGIILAVANLAGVAWCYTKWQEMKP